MILLLAMHFPKADPNLVSNIQEALDRSAIIAATDRAGDIIYANSKFCEISKYSLEELLGKNHRIINSGHHPKEFFVEMWKTISTGNIWVGEIRNRAKDGTYYWVHTTIVPLLDQVQRPYQYISIRFEITDRKKIEEQLRVSNQELERFAYVAAHDLQEPLRKIQAFGDRLLTKFSDKLTVEGADYLHRMQNAAQRMRRLIDDLLTYSRVTSQARPFQRVDLSQILKDVLSDLEIRIEQTKAMVYQEKLPVIDADSSQIHQLLQNLIANALKFHKPGLAPVVKIQGKIIKGYCEIEIIDEGIGFDQKYLEKIFTIFQRLHGKQEYEGTGLGLAVCRKIVERHGGFITATSQPGLGTKFIVRLPIHQIIGEPL